MTALNFCIKKATDGTRTRDLHLGKVAYYQLYYYRISCVCFCFVFLGTIHILPYRNGFVNRFNQKNYVALFSCFSLFFRIITTCPRISCVTFSQNPNRQNSPPYSPCNQSKFTLSIALWPSFFPFFPYRSHHMCGKAALEKVESLLL